MYFKVSLVLSVLALGWLVSACASIPLVTPVPAVAPQATTAPAAVAPDANAFPVTITHKYGSTTLTQKPERIVLVGLSEQDALLALGEVPVATREWYGEQPGAIFPWAKSKLGDAPLPTVLPSSDLNFEQVAGLKPDVIVGLYSGMTKEEYDTLSQIAPTVAQPAEYIDWGVPWQEETKILGTIVGKRAQAEALVAEVEAKFAQARKDHPEFNGVTGLAISAWGYPDSYYVYASQDSRGRFLSSLGFKIPTEIDELAAKEYGASVSRERLDLIDVDALVWFDAAESDRDRDPLYQKLKVYTEKRDLFLPATDPLYDALNLSTVLSLPYAIDNLVPRLQAAVDGDPATSPPASAGN